MSSRAGDRGWRTVLCAATGPSFHVEHAELIEATRASAGGRLRVLAINDAYRLLPFADALYACDAKWWAVHEPATREFRGERWTQSFAAAEAYGLRLVHAEKGEGLARRAEAIYASSSSGYQALGLAHLWGARRIILVGYDYQRTGGLGHFFGEHPKPLTQGNLSTLARPFPALAQKLAAAGVAVVNCTGETALRCFARARLDDILAGVLAEAPCST